MIYVDAQNTMPHVCFRQFVLLYYISQDHAQYEYSAITILSQAAILPATQFSFLFHQVLVPIFAGCPGQQRMDVCPTLLKTYLHIFGG